MRKLLLLFFIAPLLTVRVTAAEIEAPLVPEFGAELMPDHTSSFSDALLELLQKCVSVVRPDLYEAFRIASIVTCIVMAISILHGFSGSTAKIINIAGASLITSVLLKSTNSLILLGTETVVELSEYGKLLLPVMTAAMASQGGPSTSTVLYAGTAVFDVVLTGMISKLLVPASYLFVTLAVANSAIGEDILKRLRDMIKWLIGWVLKTLLTVFTTYMSISGVVSGTTDAVTLKATKFTISSVVPVVGGILSDASEAVLVSASLVKNAAGIYGILAILAVFLAPFLKIWIHYIVLKFTAALCSLFGAKPMSDLIDDFSAMMGFLLAMTGSVCLLLLISTVCYLRGIG